MKKLFALIMIVMFAFCGVALAAEEESVVIGVNLQVDEPPLILTCDTTTLEMAFNQDDTEIIESDPFTLFVSKNVVDASRRLTMTMYVDDGTASQEWNDYIANSGAGYILKQSGDAYWPDGILYLMSSSNAIIPAADLPVAATGVYKLYLDPTKWPEINGTGIFNGVLMFTAVVDNT